MKQSNRKILILGAAAKNNFGVCALASGIISSILNSFPGANIYLYDYNSIPEVYKVKHPSGTSYISLINIRFSKKIWLSNHIVRLIVTAFIITFFCPKKDSKHNFLKNQWLNHINSADLVVSIAGGDSFSDIYGLFRLIYVSLPQVLALIMGRPLVLLPQTIDPFRTSLGKKLTKCILNRAKMVYSRDKDGINYIRRISNRSENASELRYDMGFALEAKIANERVPAWMSSDEENRTLVGINISGLLYIGGYSRKNMFGLKCDYRKIIFELITKFISEHRTEVMLVPHVFGEKEGESDLVAAQKIFNLFGIKDKEHLHILDDGYDHYEIKALIGKSDFFIGSRMHACIGALSQYIPAVGLAYSRKFKGVYESIGFGELVIDLRKNDSESVQAFVLKAYKERLKTGIRLKSKMAEVRSSVLSLFSNF